MEWELLWSGININFLGGSMKILSLMFTFVVSFGLNALNFKSNKIVKLDKNSEIAIGGHGSGNCSSGCIKA